MSSQAVDVRVLAITVPPVLGGHSIHDVRTVKVSEVEQDLKPTGRGSPLSGKDI